MPDIPLPPFRRAFDAARDPLTARNALGIVGSGGGAPASAEYVTSTADATLTAERVLTDSATITWDRSTPGQIKANTAAGGGNVSNSGTPTLGQYAKWVTSTTIQGVAPATVLSDIGAAPLASPTFTGDPKAPTPSFGDNDTSIATTAFVKAQGYGDVFKASNNAFTGSNTFASSGRQAFGHTALIDTPNVEIHGATPGTAALSATLWSTNTAQDGRIYLQKTSAASVGGTRAAVTTGEALGSVIFRGDDGGTFRNSVQIGAIADGAFFGTGLPGRLQFNTANASGTLTERMRLNSAGVVTIGPNATPDASMAATGCALRGTTTNDDAAAGYVGEVLTATASSVAVTGSTWTSVVSKALTAGDWDVWGGISIPSGFTAGSYGYLVTSTTANAASTVPGEAQSFPASPGNDAYVSAPKRRISVPGGGTTVYINIFTSIGSTVSASITARRRR